MTQLTLNILDLLRLLGGLYGKAAASRLMTFPPQTAAFIPIEVLPSSKLQFPSRKNARAPHTRPFGRHMQLIEKSYPKLLLGCWLLLFGQFSRVSLTRTRALLIAHVALASKPSNGQVFRLLDESKKDRAKSISCEHFLFIFFDDVACELSLREMVL